MGKLVHLTPCTLVKTSFLLIKSGNNLSQADTDALMDVLPMSKCRVDEDNDA